MIGVAEGMNGQRKTRSSSGCWRGPVSIAEPGRGVGLLFLIMLDSSGSSMATTFTGMDMGG